MAIAIVMYLSFVTGLTELELQSHTHPEDKFSNTPSLINSEKTLPSS